MLIAIKKLTNVFVGFPCSINDSQVLHKFGLYKNAQYGRVFELVKGTQMVLHLIFWVIPNDFLDFFDTIQRKSVTFHSKIVIQLKTQMGQVNCGTCLWHTQNKLLRISNQI